MESQPLEEALVKVTKPVRLFASKMESPTMMLSLEQIVSENTPIASGNKEIVTSTMESQPLTDASVNVTEPVRLFASKMESPTMMLSLEQMVSV